MSSEYIFGIHDSGGEEHMIAARKPGWVVFSEVLGHDPNDLMGKDYTSYSRRGLGVIVRLNNGYYPQGTLPRRSEFGNFARRCANFVAASRGCHHWVIGNEMNYAIERPSAMAALGARAQIGDAISGDPTLRSLPERFSALLSAADREGPNHNPDEEELITPQSYASCYGLCRRAIHRVKGHERDQVLIGAVAPWNDQTTYPGNPGGDWIKYFQDILLQCGASGCDGITLHTFTNGGNPTLILDNSKLPERPQYHCHFQAYRDFMQAIPVNMRHLPVYITETDQCGPWENANRGWVQAAYAEIDRWNRQNEQKIRALVLYRWPQFDRWHIKGKEGIISDFRSALRHDYRWQQSPEQTRPSRDPAPAPKRPQVDVAEERRGEVAEEMKLGRGMVYRVQWMKGKPPAPLHPGQRVSFPVTIRNTGTIAWPASGAQAVAFGYHFSQNREKVPYPDGRPLLTPLPHDVAPGDVVTINAQMVIPNRSGNFTLVLDLVSGGENWFQDMQSDILTRWLSVSEPEPQAADTGQVASDPVGDGGEAQRLGKAEPASALETTPEVRVRAEAPSSSAPHGPAIVDFVASLPRGDHQFARRTLQQIRRLVICHTAAPAGVPIQAIAQAHISEGYPGIAYHYFVLETGEILQVSALEAVVNDEAEWSLSGVNICLEGNFDGQAPAAAQLTAAAQLCAWLLPRFQMTARNVVGLSELLETSSPGETFNAGPSWNKTLHKKIVEFLTDSPLSPPAETAEDDNAPPVLADSPVVPRPERPSAPKPPIEDVISRLPRDPQRFFRRDAVDIEFIVINHTAAPPITPLQTIAKAFHRRLPGILYQYFIASNGAIYQTQPLTQVVDGKIPYIARAINIGFAGEFNDVIPTAAQIKSGRQLIAWLMEEFPQLTLASIRGVNEFINHTSPGEQWLQGRRWKDILINAVRTGTDISAAPAASAGRDDDREQRSRPSSSGGQMANRQMEELREENSRLRQEISEGRTQPDVGQQIVVRPQIRDISHILPHHPTLRYRRRQLATITHIAVHHTALPPHIGPERIANAHIEEDLTRGKKAWPGIGYHYFIPPDGEILQTQPVVNHSYHVTGHNSYSVGIVFAGSFMNGYTPTPHQIQAGARLIAWLLQELRIPLSNVLGHREFEDTATACPGSEWLGGNRWNNILHEEIKRISSGIPPYHYLLFPTAEALAATLVEANDYFEKFKPSAGTVWEDALQARYVTLVGAGPGLTAEDERRLTDAGVKIDRLDDGEDGSATQKLQRLALEDRRFRSLLEL